MAEIISHEQPGGGFVYIVDDRRYVLSNRCTFCHSFGMFADTGYCQECEELVPKAARAIAKAKRLAKRDAGADEAAGRDGRAGEASDEEA